MRFALDKVTKPVADAPFLGYRVRALKRFFTHSGIEVAAGTLGGYIEYPTCLRQDDTSWVHAGGYVHHDTQILNSDVFGTVHSNSIITRSRIAGDVQEHSHITDSRVDIGSTVGYSAVLHHSVIVGASNVRGRIQHSTVRDSTVQPEATLNSCKIEDSDVTGELTGCGILNSVFVKFVELSNARIKNAFVRDFADVCAFQGFGRIGRTTTAYRSRTGEIEVFCGCFSGSLAEFRKEIRQTHKRSKVAEAYLKMVDLIELRLSAQYRRSLSAQDFL